MAGFFVDSVGNLVDIGTKVADFLSKLQTQHIDKLVKILDPGTAKWPPELQALAGNLPIAQVQEFLTRIDSETGSLKAEIGKYLKTIGQLPAEGASWSWSKDASGGAPTAGGLTFSPGANLGISASIAKPGPTYKFVGDLGVADSLMAPFSFGSAGLSGSASVHTELSSSFKHPDATPLAEALVSDLPVIQGLNSPAALVAATAFDAATLTVNGCIQLGTRLTAGTAWIGSHPVEGSPVTIEAKLGASYDFAWKRTGQFQVTVARSGQALDVSVMDKRLFTRDATVSLSAEFDIQGLQKATKPIMDRLATYPKPLQDLLNKYSDPVKLLKAKINASLNNQNDTLQGVVKSVMGEVSARQVISDACDAVTTSLGEDVQHYCDLLEGKVSGLADASLDKLTMLGEEERDRVRTWLTGRLSDVSQKLQDQLKSDIKNTVSTAKTRDQLVEALSTIGTDVQGVLNNVTLLTANLLAPIKTILTKYVDTLQRVNAAMAAIERSRLTASLGISIETSTQTTQLVALTIKKVTAGTRAAYAAMLRGDFSAAIAAANSTQNNDIVWKDCLFNSLLTHKKKVALVIDLFGVNFSWQEMVQSAVDIEARNGRISVMTAKQTASEQSAFLGESQSLTLNNALNFIGKSLAVSVLSTMQDKSPSLRELRVYIGAIEAMNLVPEGSTQRLLADPRIAALVKQETTLDVDIEFEIDNATIRKIAGLSDDEIFDVSTRAHVQAWSGIASFAMAEKKLGQRFHASPAAVIFSFRKFVQAADIKAHLGMTPGAISYGDEARQFYMVKVANEHSRALIHFMQLWRDLVNMPPPKVTNNVVDQSAVDTLHKLNDQLTIAIAPWADVPTPLSVKFDGRPSVAMMALFRALIELRLEIEPNQASVPRFVIPVVSWNEGGKRQQLAVLPTFPQT